MRLLGSIRRLVCSRPPLFLSYDSFLSCALTPLHLQYSPQVFQIFQTWSSSGVLSFHKASNTLWCSLLFVLIWLSIFLVWYAFCFSRLLFGLYVLQLFAIWDGESCLHLSSGFVPRTRSICRERSALQSNPLSLICQSRPKRWCRLQNKNKY